MTPFSALRARLQDSPLLEEESKEAFDQLFAGGVPADEIAAFLTLLADRGESAPEIAGAVRSMRGAMNAVTAPDGALDIVGTGGDGLQTLNISSATAFVAAAAGAVVAKHGNKATSSLSGASDLLARCGVNLEAPFDVLEESLATLGIAFLFAPRHHPAMRHVAEVRRALGRRTIFNILGPLTNPASVRTHLIGAYDPRLCRPMAEVLLRLGSQKGWVVHGRDGMDEITLTAPTDVVSFDAAHGVRETSLAPEEVGLAPCPLSALRGGAPEENARAFERLLNGEKGAYRDIVLMNAAAALRLAGKAGDLAQGMALAQEALDSGQALGKLRAYADLTNRKILVKEASRHV